MGLSHSVEGARYFAERTLHSLVGMPWYANSLRSLRSGYVEYGTRIALGVAAFLAPLASPSSAIAFSSNSGPEDQRNSITLANIKKQEVPPPAPGEVNPPFDLRPNMTRLIPPLLVSADGTQLQPKINNQETPVTEDAGVEPPAPPTEPEPEPKEDNNQEVPPPPEGVSANPPSVLNLGPNESQVLSLTTYADGNPIPNTPSGGETIANPVQQEYRGQRGVIVVKNRVTETGQVDVPRSITVDQDKLNQMEALLATAKIDEKTGRVIRPALNSFIINMASFDYDEAYLIFRTKDNSTIPIVSRPCRNDNDPRCKPISNSLMKANQVDKSASLTLDILREGPFTQADIDLWIEGLTFGVFDFAIKAVHGSRIALIADSEKKEEAEQLLTIIIEKAINPFRPNFTPTAN